MHMADNCGSLVKIYQIFKKRIGDITVSFNKFNFFLVDFKILGGILRQVTNLQSGMLVKMGQGTKRPAYAAVMAEGQLTLR